MGRVCWPDDVSDVRIEWFMFTVVLTVDSWFFAGRPDSHCQHDHSAFNA
jgi:hypothetical protein